MRYYKIINGQNFIGIGTSAELCRVQPKHRVLMYCGENEAQYIQIKDAFYYADWMRDTDSGINAKSAKVIEIDREEYEEYAEILSEKEEVILPEEDVPAEDESAAETETNEESETRPATVGEEILALKEYTALLEECILELSAVVYG